MSNSNEHQSNGREVRQSTYKDAQGNTHVNTTRTTETVNNVSSPDSYRNGYVNGQVSELLQEERLIERDNDNASRGLLVGILVTALAVLGGGAIWFFNQRSESPAPVAPVVVPVPDSKPDSKPSPQASKAPEKTTIIEKTKEVLVPVPQQQASPSSAPKQDVNITVPNPTSSSPAAQQAPATQSAPTQPQSQSSSTPATGTQSDNSTSMSDEGTKSDDTTSAQGASSQTDSSSSSTGSTK